MSGDILYIERCIRMIESRYNLDTGELTERDFEFLSKVIFEKTQTNISTATLRRIWTQQYQRVPQAKTLDALARFLDFEGWHQLKASTQINIDAPKNWKKNKLLIALIPLFIISVVMLLGIGKVHEVKSVVLRPEVTEHEGVPATIGFHYEIEDSDIEIELSWNPFERALLNKSGNFYSGTYYYPDYHQAKLIAGEEVLSSKNVHITTPTWHGLIMKSGLDTRPSYLEEEDFNINSQLKVSEDVLLKYGPECARQCFVLLTLSNNQLSDISGDHFSLSTSIKVNNNARRAPCEQTYLIIKGEQGSMRIPVSQLGCHGTATLKCGELVLTGKLNDLSSLSADLQVEQIISIDNRNQELTIKVGNNSEFKLAHQESIGPLKVVKFIFSGAGELSKFQFNEEEDAASMIGSIPN